MSHRGIDATHSIYSILFVHRTNLLTLSLRINEQTYHQLKIRITYRSNLVGVLAHRLLQLFTAIRSRCVQSLPMILQILLFFFLYTHVVINFISFCMNKQNTTKYERLFANSQPNSSNAFQTKCYFCTNKKKHTVQCIQITKIFKKFRT